MVGVVGRVKMEGLSQDSNRVQGYFPFWQLPFTGMTVIIKATGAPDQLIAAARDQVKQIDPDQPIYNIKTMDEIRSESCRRSPESNVVPASLRDSSSAGLSASMALCRTRNSTHTRDRHSHCYWPQQRDCSRW